MGLPAQEVAKLELSPRQFWELALTCETDGVALQREILLRRISDGTVHLWVLFKDDKIYGLEVVRKFSNEFLPFTKFTACELEWAEPASFKYKSSIRNIKPI